MNLNLKSKLNFGTGDLCYSFIFTTFGLRAICTDLGKQGSPMGAANRSWGAWAECEDQTAEMLLMFDQARANYAERLSYQNAPMYEDADASLTIKPLEAINGQKD